MKALIQRVTRASVSLEKPEEENGEESRPENRPENRPEKRQQIAAIKKGVVVLLGITNGDTEAEAKFLAEKIAQLRIFSHKHVEDALQANKEFDKSLIDIQGEALVVSQFTLYGSCDKGRRPDFNSAARPEVAEPLYELFVKLLTGMNVKVQTGKFGAHMYVALENDGPATFMIEKLSPNSTL